MKTKNRVKHMNLQEFIDYRNMIITRLHARNKNFKKDNPLDKTYYEIQLDYINEMFPEFAKLGHIELKKRS